MRQIHYGSPPNHHSHCRWIGLRVTQCRVVIFLLWCWWLFLLGWVSPPPPGALAQPGVGQRFLNPTSSKNLQEEEENGVGNDADENTCVEETCSQKDYNDDDHSNNSHSPHDLFDVFARLGTSWHSMLQTIRTIVRMAGGTTARDDVYADTMDEALHLLQHYLAPHKSEWTSVLRGLAPLMDEWDKTPDDLLRSFVAWAVADEAPDDTTTCTLEGGVNGKRPRINVSKAFRRLERYLEWMTEDDDVEPQESDAQPASSRQMQQILVDPPLTSQSLQKIWPAFAMKCSMDACGRLVWWLDLAQAHVPTIRNDLSSQDISRVFVWTSHYLLFHPNAQQQGLVFLNGLGQIDVWTFMTLLPSVELGLQLDAFFISVIPLKTKFVVLYDRPAWAKVAYQLIKPFLKGTMRRRVAVIEPGLHPPEFLTQVLGMDLALPHAVPTMTSTTEKSLVESLPPVDLLARYFLKP